MNWEFLAPNRLWLLAVVAGLGAIYIALQFRRSSGAVRFSNLDLLDKLSPGNPAWKRHLIAASYLLSLCILTVGVAQPTAKERVPKERATIMVAIDTSLSMQATDVDPTRIDSAKVAAAKFVSSIPRKLQVGLVSFNGSTKLLVPPTTDRTSIERAIKGLRLGEGTAIGDAVLTSLDAIADVPEDSNGKRAPAVVVLLSDGKTTVGTPTEDVIEPAKKADVPVWTIAYGTPNGYVEVDPDNTGFTERVAVPVDYPSLEQLASGTGGQAFRAESSTDLSSVYDKLGGSIGYDHEQREITWKLLMAGLVLLMVVNGLSLWWFQRVP